MQADGESDEEDGGAAGSAPVGRPRATTEARHACLAQPSRRGLFFACPLLSCSFLSQAVAAGLSSTLQQAEALEACTLPHLRSAASVSLPRVFFQQAAGFAEKAAEVRAAAMEASSRVPLPAPPCPPPLLPPPPPRARARSARPTSLFFLLHLSLLAPQAAAGAYHAQHVEPAEAGAEVGAEVA